MGQVRRRQFLIASGALLAAPFARAQANGTKIPQSVLLRADRVIE